jgi:hypothetical protein
VPHTHSIDNSELTAAFNDEESYQDFEIQAEDCGRREEAVCEESLLRS